MNLQDSLFLIENFLGIETDSLYPLAQADNIGGYHPDPTQRQWNPGAVWDVEGRTIYALIRALQPVNVVEIGSGLGCSTNHIASALKANSIERFEHVGHLVTLDRGNTPQVDGRWDSYVTALPGDAFEYLELLPDNSVDFILEDADHSEVMCYRVGELAKRKLAPGGVLVAHDAAHPTVGADVKAGFTQAGINYRVYLTEPSDCGLLVWRKSTDYNVGAYSEDGGRSWVSVRNTDADGLAKLNELARESLDKEPVLQSQEKQSTPKAKRTRKAAKK